MSDHGSWGWDSQCCGCEGAGLEGLGHAEASLLVAATLARRRAPRSLKHPSFCQQLHEGAQVPYCEGEASCACQSYCAAAPLATYASDPDCCGCEGAAA